MEFDRNRSHLKWSSSLELTRDPVQTNSSGSRLLTGIAKRPAIACEALKLCRLKIIVIPPEYLLALMHREMKLNKLVIYMSLSHAEMNRGKSEKQKLPRIFYSLREAFLDDRSMHVQFSKLIQ